MNFDQPNIIVENIFTNEEIEQIYGHINNTSEDDQQLVEIFSQKAYHSWLPLNIVAKLTAAAQSTTDTRLVLRELSFARYAKFSEDLPVQLVPHTDQGFREPRLTFDIQLKSNRDWAIVVEGTDYVLKDNQALTFSGTHQVHWREKTEFLGDDFMDMIFAHFSEADCVANVLGDFTPGVKPDAEHDIIMEVKQKHWTKIYNESK